MAKKPILCASCRVECIVEGNKLTCPKCGASFIKQGDEVKVEDIGRFEKLEQRVDALEQSQQQSEPKSELEPEPENDDEDDW